jgi:4-amino-4-deoxy-L-arabinose transferase-like glycosyltransferase
MSVRVRPRLVQIAPVPVMMGLAGLLVVVKLYMLASANVFQDEAYYWMWGQHPALSYYDHPPLTAWVQGLSGALFGWTRLALRLPVALALAADIALLWLISRRIAGDEPAHFWVTLLLFLGTPVFFLTTTFAVPDHLMTTFLLAAVYGFTSFLQRWPEEARWPDLYLGAAALGLAGLSKYNAALLGVALALYIIISPRMRPLLARPQLYWAAGIVFALQAPVIVWNLQQELASFNFILGRRHVWPREIGPGLLVWLSGFLLGFGPFLGVAFVRFAARTGDGDGFPRTAVWLSTIVILVVATRTFTLFHWNLVAYLVALPLLGFYLARRWVGWAHLALSFVIIAAIAISATITPLGRVQNDDNEATAWAYGWEETAEAVRVARAEHPVGFVATADYTTAALLGYALGDKAVTSLSTRFDQYDFWFDAEAQRGQDAILYGDLWRPVGKEISALFDELVVLARLPIVRGGQELDVRTIYLARNYQPAE